LFDVHSLRSIKKLTGTRPQRPIRSTSPGIASLPGSALQSVTSAPIFNALSHSQFANPDTAYSDGSAFGQIASTSVAPRIGQLAMKMHF
jgi:hypothetical protein